jgi:tetratricopeptide (TPR) repeat protein
VFLVLAHDRRRILHFNVTAHPTAEWTAQQQDQHLSLCHWNLHQYQDAIEAARKAIALAPGSAEPYCALGLAFEGQQKHEDAREAYERALKLKPELPETWHNLGELDLETGRYEDAVTDLEKALAFGSGYSDTYYSLGLAHPKLGNTAAALAQCERLRSLDPDKERDLRNQITSETA